MDYTVTLQSLPNTGRIQNSTRRCATPHKRLQFYHQDLSGNLACSKSGENKDPTKWQSCPSDAVIEACQNKCAWWSSWVLVCTTWLQDEHQKERISSYYLCIKKVITNFEYIFNKFLKYKWTKTFSQNHWLSWKMFGGYSDHCVSTRSLDSQHPHKS